MVYEEKPRKVWVGFFACLLVLFVCFPQALKKRQWRSYCYYLNWDVVEAGEDGHKVDSPQRCMVKGRWAKQEIPIGHKDKSISP